MPVQTCDSVFIKSSLNCDYFPKIILLLTLIRSHSDRSTSLRLKRAGVSHHSLTGICVVLKPAAALTTAAAAAAGTASTAGGGVAALSGETGLVTIRL